MNVLANHVKFLSSKVVNAVKKEGVITRNYAFKTDLKIKWVRPEQIPAHKAEASGDLGLNLSVSPKDYARMYDKSNELQTANEMVKKMFTLEYLPAKYTTCKRRDLTLARVQRHRCDRGSMESKIAVMTNTMEQMREKVEACPSNIRLRVALQELIERRKKFLGYLRTWDYKRFEWLLEQLNLIYKPHPTSFHRLSRKESLTKLTDKHCEDIIQKKLDAYRSELTAQQKSFFKEKAEKLAFIRSEELAFGLKPSISEEDIEEARKKYESFK